MINRHVVSGVIGALAIAGSIAAPAVVAAPYAGQYVGLAGTVAIDGSDGATYRVDVEVTAPAEVNVGTARELRLDITRCVRTRCVEIGHHLKPLLPTEVEIAEDFRSGSVRTAFGGRTLSAVWRDPDPTGLGDVTGLSSSGIGTSGPPHPGVNPEVSRRSWQLAMTLDLGVAACATKDAFGFEVTGADTVGRETRETRTPEPLRLHPGLSAAGRRAPRCTPQPKPAETEGKPPAAAEPEPAKPLPMRRQIVEIRRTRKSGIAVLALAGRVTSSGRPGFFAALDVYRDGGDIRSIPKPNLVDFGVAQEPTQYGHGSDRPLCNLPLVCVLDKAGGELSFTMTVTDDTRTNNAWQGRTHYLLLEGTGFELESAAVGFRVTRRAGGFDRRTAIDSDADGVAALGAHAEVFRAASLMGGPKGSVVVAQLPCEVSGAGAATLTHDSGPDGLLNIPMSCEIRAGGMAVNPDSHIRTGARTKPGAWRLEGAVAGVTAKLTRLLVMNL